MMNRRDLPSLKSLHGIIMSVLLILGFSHSTIFIALHPYARHCDKVIAEYLVPCNIVSTLQTLTLLILITTLNEEIPSWDLTWAVRT